MHIVINETANTRITAMLKIAKITLPETDNDGNSGAHAHAFLKSELLKAFGGYTAVPVFGAWRDENTGEVFEDESIRYEVAINPTSADSVKLIQLAREAGSLCGQLAMAVELPEAFYIFDMVETSTTYPITQTYKAGPTPAGGFTL